MFWVSTTYRYCNNTVTASRHRNMKLLLWTTFALLVLGLTYAEDLTKRKLRRDPREHPLLPSECGRDHVMRIVGAEDTMISEFPWMALLEYRTPNGQQLLCGGFLISNRYVLTAAHCIPGRNEPKFLTSVRLGEHDLETNPDCSANGNTGRFCADEPVSIEVEDQIVHEMYSNENDTVARHDIALLRLKREVNFTLFVSPICLPISGALPRDFEIAGWGLTEYETPAPVKKKLTMPYVSMKTCQDKYLEGIEPVYIEQGQLCAGGEWNRGVCHGDSGGPLMNALEAPHNKRWIAYGIASFGHTPCGETGWPAVFTNVDDYYDWIISKLKA